ncbi:S-adenosyl-L-methionine-dependent methyltransferase [Nemania sp. NC0429]|nr:S-adenosyl-L-methionine-dependent methyltransferase [Nemania sp. NC0429]
MAEYQADTVELSDEVRETFVLHNRSFQRYAIDNSTYFVPVDEDETLRLRIQHRVLTMMFDNRFIFPPIDAPRRVLDCGFGTGEWALQVAWEHPRCEVRGIDITPHHHNPDEGLENLYLDVDDLNMSFQFSSNHFDLVNSRLVAGGINSERWTGYIRDIYRCLRPGGWVQMVEIDFNAQSDNGALAESKLRSNECRSRSLELTPIWQIRLFDSGRRRIFMRWNNARTQELRVDLEVGSEMPGSRMWMSE